jgi:hypothetical protein
MLPDDVAAEHGLKTVAEQVVDRLAEKPIGHDIDYLYSLREKKRKAEEAVDAISKHMAEVEQRLIERMEREGMKKATSAKATVAITPKVRPYVTDWELFYDFVHRNKSYHLLERRVAAAAWNEICEKRKGKPVPGTEPFVKTSLSLRVNS